MTIEQWMNDVTREDWCTLRKICQVTHYKSHVGYPEIESGLYNEKRVPRLLRYALLTLRQTFFFCKILSLFSFFILHLEPSKENMLNVCVKKFKNCTVHILYCRAYGNYMRRGLDCQLDLLDHTQLQLQCITLYTLYNTTVDHNTRLETAPQPVFHCNQLLWHP
jgi:hypothetical protein